jgi:hypothetical protein
MVRNIFVKVALAVLNPRFYMECIIQVLSVFWQTNQVLVEYTVFLGGVNLSITICSFWIKYL